VLVSCALTHSPIPRIGDRRNVALNAQGGRIVRGMIKESHVEADIQTGPMTVSIEHLVFLAVLLAVKTVHCGVLWRRERRLLQSEDHWRS